MQLKLFRKTLGVTIFCLCLTMSAGPVFAMWGPDENQKVLADDGFNSQQFGYSVSISGKTAVVGCLVTGSNDTNDPGSAYVFEKTDGSWNQVAKLVALDGEVDDDFGRAVSISDDTIIVGASGDDDNGSNSGSAYIFYRNQDGADKWGQKAKLLPDDGDTNDGFGNSVSISGDTVIVGSSRDDDKGSSSGSAYIFYRDQDGADKWGQKAKVLASDGAASDSFGRAVSISNGMAIVGAIGNDDYGSSSGSAYVFSRDQDGAGKWGQAAKRLPGDGARKD